DMSNGTEQRSPVVTSDGYRTSTARSHCEHPHLPEAPDIPNGTSDSKVRIMFRDNPSITDMLREEIKPTPVKRRIQFAAYKLRTQTNRLEKTINQMEHRDRILHDKC